MDRLSVPDPLLLPRRYCGDVESLGVLTTSDPHPPPVIEAVEDLTVRVTAGERLATAEHSALSFRDQPELRIHPTSMVDRPSADRPRDESVDNQFGRISPRVAPSLAARRGENGQCEGLSVQIVELGAD